MPPNLVEEFSSGDTVCGSCGRVLGERAIDTRSEWRYIIASRHVWDVTCSLCVEPFPTTIRATMTRRVLETQLTLFSVCLFVVPKA